MQFLEVTEAIRKWWVVSATKKEKKWTVEIADREKPSKIITYFYSEFLIAF